MNPELKAAMAAAFDEIMEARLKSVVSGIATNEVRSIVEQLRKERSLFGNDRTGLTDKQKKDFAEAARAIALKMNIDTKANEALIEEQDNRGGYLVSKDIANAILRIAATVGITMSQAQKWDLKTDELGIPNYTGSFLEGEYLGVDAAGTPTALTFGQALLIAKKWQLAFVVGNDLIADASVNLADWLLAIGGEALANMIDKQAFVGTAPFVGLTKNTAITAYNLGGSTTSGKTTFASMDPLVDGSDIIGSLEESVLDGAAFYFHRTVWAKIRSYTNATSGIPSLAYNGSPSATLLAQYAATGGPRPVGEILGYPVFTCRHLPANSATAVSTIFGVFGNMKAMAYGDKGELRVSQFESGAFGGKEIALADQRALVYKHRHALVTALPAAFVTIKTSAS